MTQTLAWAAEKVLVPFTGAKEEVHPEISASYVFCLNTFKTLLWRNVVLQVGKMTRHIQEHLNANLQWQSSPRTRPSVKDEENKRRIPARVIREGRLRAGSERVVKKKSNQQRWEQGQKRNGYQCGMLRSSKTKSEVGSLTSGLSGLHVMDDILLGSSTTGGLWCGERINQHGSSFLTNKGNITRSYIENAHSRFEAISALRLTIKAMLISLFSLHLLGNIAINVNY